MNCLVYGKHDQQIVASIMINKIHSFNHIFCAAACPDSGHLVVRDRQPSLPWWSSQFGVHWFLSQSPALCRLCMSPRGCCRPALTRKIDLAKTSLLVDSGFSFSFLTTLSRRLPITHFDFDGFVSLRRPASDFLTKSYFFFLRIAFYDGLFTLPSCYFEL